MTWEPDPGEIERHYPARTPLPPGYRVIWSEGSEHYLWITEDGAREGCDHWNHWACWRGAWADYCAADTPPPVTTTDTGRDT